MGPGGPRAGRPPPPCLLLQGRPCNLNWLLLQSKGYTAGVDLFGAGYDFRQSCRVSARALLACLQVRQPPVGGRAGLGAQCWEGRR